MLSRLKPGLLLSSLLLLLLSLCVVPVYGESILSSLRITASPEKYDDQNIVLMGIVEDWKHNDAGYYEIDIYKDMTVVFDSPVLPKNLKKGDLLKIKGRYHAMIMYHNILYNNLVLADSLKKMEGL